MNIHDFSIAFQQKFDFNGKPYVFDKIDVTAGTQITLSTLGKYQNYTPSQQHNVMLVLSDALCQKTSGTIFQLFESGEVIYLSTFIDKINMSNQSYFANVKDYLETGSFGQGTTKKFFGIQCAGTIYIYDFN